jgi:hypothetical protein
VNEGQGLAPDGGGSSDPADGLAYAWDLDDDGQYDDAVGQTPAVSWGTLTGLGLPSDGTVVAVGLQVTDADGATATDATTLAILNVAPTADAGGAYSISDGEDLALDGTASSDPGGDALNCLWDLDNDGQYDDAAGPAPVVPWATIVALGLPTDGTPIPVGIRLTDGDGAFATAATTLRINAPAGGGAAGTGADGGTVTDTVAGAVASAGSFASTGVPGGGQGLLLSAPAPAGSGSAASGGGMPSGGGGAQDKTGEWGAWGSQEEIIADGQGRQTDAPEREDAKKSVEATPDDATEETGKTPSNDAPADTGAATSTHGLPARAPRPVPATDEGASQDSGAPQDGAAAEPPADTTVVPETGAATGDGAPETATPATGDDTPADPHAPSGGSETTAGTAGQDDDGPADDRPYVWTALATLGALGAAGVYHKTPKREKEKK